jgi:26S proteasome regulatory subunit T1
MTRVERSIRFDLIARLCPNATGAELRSVCTEAGPFATFLFHMMLTVACAGMFAIRARRKVANEKDFLDAVEKVIRQGAKFSSTASSLVRFWRRSHAFCRACTRRTT